MRRMQYQIAKLEAGRTIEIADGNMITGTSLEPDGKGGYLMVVHMLVAIDPPLAEVIPHKELGS